MPTCHLSPVTCLSSQKGALFGLDARIALAIFSIISVVAGTAMVVNLDSVRAKSLAQELTETTRAIESFHNDLQTDIYQTLDKPTDKNAFQALYDPTVITESRNLRSHWHGPYIKFTSTIHPTFGEMLLQKRATNHTEDCEAEGICDLWLVYSNTPKGVIIEVNEILDGAKEENPGQAGRIQWSTASGGTQSALFYRAARALTAATE
jgi:hypothetical protein